MSLTEYKKMIRKINNPKRNNALGALMSKYITSPTVYEKVCEKCGKTFMTLDKNVRFCSASCSGQREKPNFVKRNRQEAMKYTSEAEIAKFLRVYNRFVYSTARGLCGTNDDLLAEVISTFNFNLVLLIKNFKFHNLDIFNTKVAKGWIFNTIKWTVCNVLRKQKKTTPLEKIEYKLTYESEDFDNEFDKFE